MTHRQPKFSQVLVCEIGQDAKIDIVLSKALRILGHAELFEPLRKVLHCASPSAIVRAFCAKISDYSSDVNRPAKTRGSAPLATLNSAVRRRERCMRLWGGECP